MTPERRAAELYELLKEVGFRSLVMGGHAVRFYGIDRRTVDFDLHIALEPEQWSELARRLSASGRLTTLVEGPSWRPRDFKRFVVGQLSDGREERLELWRANHLLPPFETAWSRREEGVYGGKRLAFLGLDDLIRSKETERDDDWSDVRILEEIADERRLGTANAGDEVVHTLAHLRSRRGYELARSRGFLDDRALVAEALSRATNGVTAAFLVPYAAGGKPSSSDDLLTRALATVSPGSAKHMALVEAARNRRKTAAAAADRADKERARREQKPA